MRTHRAKRGAPSRAMAACVGASFLLFASVASAETEETNDVVQTSSQQHEITRRAEALRDQLRASDLPQATPIPLASNRELTERMIDAEVRFDLEEWVHCASLLAPVIQELRALQHPAYERALYLFAESLYQSQSHALARAAFERIVDESQPTYRKDAMMRLLEIELAAGTRRTLETRYNALLKEYGASGDGDVYYLLARTRYFQREYADAAAGFDRIASDSARYWRAQYHAGVALAREGQIDKALERFESIELELARRTSLSDNDYEVLQYARFGQGVAHYETETWDAAQEAYSRVAPDSLAYPQALYQRAWSDVRQENIPEALAHLEMLEVASNSTRLISEARLLAADLQRHERDYNAALAAYGRASDDLELVRLELRDIRVRKESTVPERVDATEEILTGNMLAEFDPDHWFPDDPIARRGLELLRASETLADWLVVNQDIADEIRDALESGFAYDRAIALRDARAAFVEARSHSARWWGELAAQTRTADPSSEQYEAQHATEQAKRAYQELPVESLHDNVQNVRSIYEERELTLYKEEQTLLTELDSIDARLRGIREQLQLQRIEPESAGQERQELQPKRAQLQREINALRDARAHVQRQRVRYGIGEAQSIVLERSRDYIQAAKDELRAAGIDVEQPGRALESLDQTIDAGLHTLNERVKTSWQQAYLQLEEEQGDVHRLEANHQNFDAKEMHAARTVAMEGFLAMLGNVKSVALRANLGEIDVAWWQKEDVSQRIDSLFKEQERQILRLDAGFSELRE